VGVCALLPSASRRCNSLAPYCTAPPAALSPSLHLRACVVGGALQQLSSLIFRIALFPARSAPQHGNELLIRPLSLVIQTGA
jgi:hypothetical protein